MRHMAVEPTNPAFECDESGKWFPEERGRCLQELGPSVEDEGGAVPEMSDEAEDARFQNGGGSLVYPQASV